MSTKRNLHIVGLRQCLLVEQGWVVISKQHRLEGFNLENMFIFSLLWRLKSPRSRWVPIHYSLMPLSWASDVQHLAVSWHGLFSVCTILSTSVSPLKITGHFKSRSDQKWLLGSFFYPFKNILCFFLFLKYFLNCIGVQLMCRVKILQLGHHAVGKYPLFGCPP